MTIVGKKSEGDTIVEKPLGYGLKVTFILGAEAREKYRPDRENPEQIEAAMRLVEKSK